MVEQEVIKRKYKKLFLLLTICFSVLCNFSFGQKKWVGTWSTAPQLVEPHNMPPEPGLSNNCLRQIVRVSIGGKTIRVKFSNQYGTSAVTMKSVQIAISAGKGAIIQNTNKELKFSGKAEVTIAPGQVITSDQIEFNLPPRTDVAITIYYGETSTNTTGHPGSRTTSYLLAGNDPTVSDFSKAITTDHWYNILGIDVLASASAASIAILGNSITDGRGSVTNEQNRWPDIFSERLLQNKKTNKLGVLNLGIGGNCVLFGGLGPTAQTRFDYDILKQAGVGYAIIFIGVNDIGGVKTAETAQATAEKLISAFKLMIEKAHNNNIKVIGATILPFFGNSYYNEHSEACRNTVNQWIRTSNAYDKVIDFDLAVRNPEDTKKLKINTFQNDNLHPDAAGYKLMGEFVDLNIFTKKKNK